VPAAPAHWCNMINIGFKKNHPDVLLPVKATPGSAGADIRAYLPDGDIGIPPGQTIAVPTGFAMEIPVGYEAQVRSRSGLALKNAVVVANSPGTIDSDFKGEVRVILTNNSDVMFFISHNDRIAQLVIAAVLDVTFTEVVELSETERGAGGFGSSGIR
jgi:dUTP pyrophosphatase